MSGRLEDDEKVAGFTCLEDTQIPALQKHALAIVQDTRAVTGRRFLHDLGRLLSSLHLQVVLSDQPLKLAGDLKEKEFQSLAEAIDALQLVRALSLRKCAWPFCT
jgi:hypothetical protein